MDSITRIPVADLRRAIHETLVLCAMSEHDAETVADVYIRATLRGVGHHDISDLPGRIQSLRAGKINPTPKIRLTAQKAAVEAYDGDNGPGELHGMFIMRRAMELARTYGVGLCSIHNSNHILASSPYVEVAAENGFFGYVVTRGAPTMGAPGRLEKVSGTAPQGFSVPSGGKYPIMFDACIAYTSNGVLKEKADAGEAIPPHWGLDAEGRPTTDPNAVMKGCRQPIGGHKGFGLSILGEILTGVLSGGPVIDAAEESTGKENVPSHTAFCVDIGALHGQERFEAHISEMVDRMKARADGLTIPGERSGKSRERISVDGIELSGDMIEKLNALRGDLGLSPLNESAFRR